MKVHVISWCFRNALYEVYEFQKYKIIEVTSSMKPSYEQNGGQFPSADCTDKEFVGISITRDADFNLLDNQRCNLLAVVLPVSSGR